jgi:hypothetical protein
MYRPRLCNEYIKWLDAFIDFMKKYMLDNVRGNLCCPCKLSTSHRQIFMLGLGETRRSKINLEDEHDELDWFSPSRGVIALRPIFAVLCREN